MKEYLAKIKLLIDRIDKPSIELPYELKSFYLVGTCISCGNMKTLKCRKILDETVILDSYHCPDCKDNWAYEVNLLTNTILYQKKETNWVDLYNEQNDD